VRSIGSLVGILVVALVVGLTYKYYFSQNQKVVPASNPQQTIDVTGVKSDLLGMAQAERVYQTEHNSYGSLDDLVSSGAMTMKKSGRNGYTYEAEASAGSFRIIAHCPSATWPGCTNYVIDQTMEVQPAP
jgi:competence protein ComGC